MVAAEQGAGGRRRGVFEVDEDAALAELEKAWADGGYHGFGAANAAIHRIVLCRMRYHEATRAYVTRRTADGKTNREIRRCLKRYACRAAFRQLQTRMS